MTREIGLAVFVVAVLAVALFAFGRAGPSRPRTTGTAVKVGVPAEGRVEKSDDEWRAELAPEVYRVARRAGTERAFSGALWDQHAAGEYRCACCGQRLFDSATKFESGTGWPSFWQPTDDNAVSQFEDRDGFGVRVEVTCSRCDAHLGHVFDDGPKPTGQRYCMNSAALTFQPR